MKDRHYLRTLCGDRRTPRSAWIPASVGMTDRARNFGVMPVKACPVLRYEADIQGWRAYPFGCTRAEALHVQSSIDSCLRRPLHNPWY